MCTPAFRVFGGLTLRHHPLGKQALCQLSYSRSKRGAILAQRPARSNERRQGLRHVSAAAGRSASAPNSNFAYRRPKPPGCSYGRRLPCSSIDTGGRYALRRLVPAVSGRLADAWQRHRRTYPPLTVDLKNWSTRWPSDDRTRANCRARGMAPTLICSVVDSMQRRRPKVLDGSSTSGSSWRPTTIGRNDVRFEQRSPELH
jgi:hypothetical protein